MKNPLVSIIVPTYNREMEVISCLNSLAKITYTPFEIIVVDNASEDNTCAKIAKKFPNVKLVRLKSNTGAVGGRNAGIDNAKGDYLLFVDSDNFVKPDFLSKLVGLAESDPKIGFVGPKMYYYHDPKRIWFAGVKINLLTSKTKYIGINQIDRGQFDSVKETDQIPNVWLVKSEVVDKIGKLDEIYVMSYGESDWPMRARQAGYKIMYCPESVVYHDIPVPKDVRENIMLRGNVYRTYYFARNRLIFMSRFAPPLNFVIFLLVFNNFFLVAYILTFIKFKQLQLVGPYIRGYLDGLKLATIRL